MTLDEHRPPSTWSGTTDEAIRLLESWLYDPCQDEHEQARELARLIRSMNRRFEMPDSILQSALYGRLMAAGLSGVSAVLLFLDQANAALGAGLAVVAAAAAAASKLREFIRAWLM